VVAEPAGKKRPVRVGELVGDLAEGDSVKRKPLRVRLDADFTRRAAYDVSRADAVDFCQLVLELFRDLLQSVAGPLGGFVRLGRQREHDDGDVVDPAPDDQRLWNAFGD